MKQNNPYKAQKAGKRFYPAFMLLVLLLASCSKDDALTVDYGPSGKKTSLQVTALTTASGVITRATTTPYPTTGSIGFFMRENLLNGYVAGSNIKGIYDNAKYHLWLPVDSIWLNNNTADLAVYAPYDAAHGTDGTLKLAACIRVDGSKDIAYNAFTANNKTTPPVLTLAHVYSRLTINITRADEYAKEVILNSIGMKGNEIYKEASFRPLDNAKDYGTKTFTFPIDPAVKVNDANPTQIIELLLIPSSLTGDVTLFLDGPDENFKVVFAKVSFGNALTAGKQYKINLKLKGTILEVTSVTITDWEIEKIDDEQEPPFID